MFELNASWVNGNHMPACCSKSARGQWYQYIYVRGHLQLKVYKSRKESDSWKHFVERNLNFLRKTWGFTNLELLFYLMWDDSQMGYIRR